MKGYTVYLYVWGGLSFDGTPSAPKVLAYVIGGLEESPAYWKAVTVRAPDSRRAKQEAIKAARAELHRLGLYDKLTRTHDGIRDILEATA